MWPGRGAIIDIINIIDRLETLVETSKTVPVSGNILIDRKKMMELVDQLRLTIPEEVRAAEDVLSQKDQILNIAQNDARRTKSTAEDELRDRLKPPVHKILRPGGPVRQMRWRRGDSPGAEKRFGLRVRIRYGLHEPEAGARG